MLFCFLGAGSCMPPFQLLYDDDKLVAFKHENYTNCSLVDVKTKYPNSNTWNPLSWLNDTYINIIIQKDLVFKVRLKQFNIFVTD